MAGTYEHLIVRHMGDTSADLVNEGAVATGQPRPSHIGDAFALMRSEDVPQSKVHMTYSWIGPTDEGSHWVNEHEHDYDEILVFLGSDPEHPHDLGGKAYLWIEGEKYTINTSGAVYIPAGTRHCPLDWGTVTRPIRFNAISLSGDGTYDSDEDVPEEVLAAQGGHKSARRIRALVDTYAKGCADADADLVASVFADDARMWGWLGDEYVAAPITAFLDVVRESASDPDRARGYSHEVLDVSVHGRYAQVTFTERGSSATTSPTRSRSPSRTADGWSSARPSPPTKGTENDGAPCNVIEATALGPMRRRGGIRRRTGDRAGRVFGGDLRAGQHDGRRRFHREPGVDRQRQRLRVSVRVAVDGR